MGICASTVSDVKIVSWSVVAQCSRIDSKQKAILASTDFSRERIRTGCGDGSCPGYEDDISRKVFVC